MASNKNVVCLIKEAISAINFDGSWSTGIVKQKLEEYREFLFDKHIISSLQ